LSKEGRINSHKNSHSSNSKIPIFEGKFESNNHGRTKSINICDKQFSDSDQISNPKTKHGDLGECVLNKKYTGNDNINVNVNVNLKVNGNKHKYNQKNVSYYTSKIIIISTIIMLSLTIGLLLLAQTIEPNPGPIHNDENKSSEFGSEKGLTPGLLRRIGESETK
jgi:hypothetical protein